MTTQFKSDIAIQKDILEELKWDPAISEADIGVEVDDGVVTLNGTVDSYTKKFAAERAALRVQGVRALAEDIEINVYNDGLAKDTEIASDVASILENHNAIPQGRIKIRVEKGRVTLTGSVNWQYQRALAEDAVRNVRRVTKIKNEITISQPAASASAIKNALEQAFQRNARIDAQRVSVKVDGGHVVLSGTVDSWAERAEADTAAWRGAGVTRVTNLIKVQP